MNKKHMNRFPLLHSSVSSTTVTVWFRTMTTFCFYLTSFHDDKNKNKEICSILSLVFFFFVTVMIMAHDVHSRFFELSYYTLQTRMKCFLQYNKLKYNIFVRTCYLHFANILTHILVFCSLIDEIWVFVSNSRKGKWFVGNVLIFIH